ncbi:MAG: alpha/beta hydrolase [Clostridiales bacterium]|nr:alpha/beta hydrolase [Clostridiales bacterium]
MLLIIIFSIIGIFILIILYLSCYLVNNIVYNKKKSNEDLEDYNKKTFQSDWLLKINSWYEQVEKKYYSVKSDYGYMIDCYEIVNNPNKYVVLLHGVTTNKEFVKKFAYLYKQLDYSIIALDHRSHGKSGGSTITYGYYEKYDLLKIITHLKEQKGSDCIIGLHGESMGASILLAYASMVEDGCKFYIADCPYSDFAKQIKNNVTKKINTLEFITSLIMETTNVILKLLFSFDIKGINIVNNISKVKNPILFLNAKDDDYIDPAMTSELYNNCIGENKEIHWFKTGFHAGSFSYQPEEYIETVKKFLEKYIED